MFKRKGTVILRIILSSALGVLLHFVYEWTGKNKFAGYISAVNESTWEHLKLLFVPVLIFTIFEWIYARKKYPNLIFSRAVSVVIGMLFIVVSYFTISGITGKTNMPVVNIAIFLLSVIITFVLSEVIMNSIFNMPKYSNLIGVAIFLLFAVLFAVWTYFPPSIGLFIEPK